MSLEKLKKRELFFYLECVGIKQPLYCSEGMEFQDYVLYVKTKIESHNNLSSLQKIDCLELFQLWIVEHFGVVLNVFSSDSVFL